MDDDVSVVGLATILVVTLLAARRQEVHIVDGVAIAAISRWSEAKVHRV